MRKFSLGPYSSLNFSQYFVLLLYRGSSVISFKEFFLLDTQELHRGIAVHPKHAIDNGSLKDQSMFDKNYC